MILGSKQEKRDPTIVETLNKASPRIRAVLFPKTISELVFFPVVLEQYKRTSGAKRTTPGVNDGRYVNSDIEAIVKALIQAKMQNLRDFRDFAYVSTLAEHGRVPVNKEGVYRGIPERPDENYIITNERELLEKLFAFDMILPQHKNHLKRVDISVSSSDSNTLFEQMMKARRHLIDNQQTYLALDSLRHEEVHLVLNKILDPFNKKIHFTVQKDKLLVDAAEKLATNYLKQHFDEKGRPIKADFSLEDAVINDWFGFALVFNETIKLPYSTTFRESDVYKAQKYFLGQGSYFEVHGNVKNFYINDERDMKGVQLYVVPNERVFGYFNPTYHELIQEDFQPQKNLAISVHLQAYTEYFNDKFGATSHIIYEHRKTVRRQQFLQRLAKSEEASQQFARGEEYIKKLLGL